MRSNKSTVVGSFTEVGPTVLAKDHIELEYLKREYPDHVVTINTRNTCYRMEVLDGSARRVLITGGILFPNGTEVEVIGASDDTGVRDGFVVEGLQLELSTQRGPILTSTVVSLSVDSATATLELARSSAQ